jgi:uncharacterized Tic20 family protein
MDDGVKEISPMQNDRIMAALAHAAIIWPMMGIVASIVIWATQKDKSKYIAYQALQAIAYQASMIIVWFAGMAVYMCSFFTLFLTSTFRSSSESFPVVFTFPFIVMGTVVIGSIVFIIYGLVGAAMVLQGKEFRYIVIGKRLERYLQQK